MQMIRVLVVDDMQPICRRYEKLINQKEDMEVVGLAFSGAEALEMVRNLEPNVVLMDIEMETKTSGLDASRDILQMYPEMKIIILTVYEEDEFVFQAFQLGVTDYLIKNSGKEEIISCIKDAYAGNLANPACHRRRSKRISAGKDQRTEFSLLSAHYSRDDSDGNRYFESFKSGLHENGNL